MKLGKIIQSIFGLKEVKKKRPKDFSLDMGNVSIPVQYRVGFMQMSGKEREKFLDAAWEDVQSGLAYTKEWQGK